MLNGYIDSTPCTVVESALGPTKNADNPVAIEIILRSHPDANFATATAVTPEAAQQLIVQLTHALQTYNALKVGIKALIDNKAVDTLIASQLKP